jgi:hypothetical protein
MFEKAGYYKSIINNIYNEIENNYYDYKDFRIYLAYNFIFEPKFSLYFGIDQKKINEIKNLLSEKNYENDENFISQLIKNIKLNKEDLFKYNEKGNTYISLIIKNKYISPLYWFKNKQFLDTVKQENKENKDHKKFRKRLTILEREVCNG